MNKPYQKLQAQKLLLSIEEDEGGTDGHFYLGAFTMANKLTGLKKKP